MENNSGEGWYEFFRMPTNTTHIAYISENGDIYFPENGISHDDWLGATIKGNVHKLVRAVR